MNEKIIVGLHGGAGSGKDTLATYMADVFHFKYTKSSNRLAFADPIRQIALMFGFTMEQCTDRVLKETVDSFWGISPRKFTQLVGTEMFRNIFRPDCWTTLLRRKADLLTDPVLFITDIRMDNEAELVHAMGGVVLHVKRDAPTSLVGDTTQHVTERTLDPRQIDSVIYNDGTLDELMAKATETVDKLELVSHAVQTYHDQIR